MEAAKAMIQQELEVQKKKLQEIIVQKETQELKIKSLEAVLISLEGIPNQQSTTKEEILPSTPSTSSSSFRRKYYVIFNGPMEGIYDEWHKCAQFINGQSNIIHKSYNTLAEAKEALESSKVQRSSIRNSKIQSLNYRETLVSQPERKLPVIGKIPNARITNIATRSEKEILKQPSFEKFKECYNQLANYSEKDKIFNFYPVIRLGNVPKAVTLPGSSPLQVAQFFIHGLLDTIYLTNFSEISELPSGINQAIKIYKNKVANDREMFAKFYSSYPIFRNSEIIIPSFSVIQLGVSNRQYPSIDIPKKHELSQELMDEQTGKCLAGLLGITSQKNNKSTIKINYWKPPTIIIFSAHNHIIDERGLEALAAFEASFLNLYEEPLNRLPPQIKLLLKEAFPENIHLEDPNREDEERTSSDKGKEKEENNDNFSESDKMIVDEEE